jgi:hypothetical protein
MFKPSNYPALKTVSDHKNIKELLSLFNFDNFCY